MQALKAIRAWQGMTVGLGLIGFRLDTAPSSNSWIINISGLYIALNRTPNMDCYWVGAVPKVWDLGLGS